MAGRAELLFSKLTDKSAILELIGEPEDGHLDCKEWPTKDRDGHETLAKAVCGFANADGGVLVIGMRAKQKKPGDPDVVTETAPVPDATLLQSLILNLVGNLVEPPIAGMDTRSIPDVKGSKSGFVIVHIPRSDGPPHRSRKDSKFYIRVGCVTLPMEYWQIEDRFGTRPHPRLELHLEMRPIAPNPYQVVVRPFALGLKNTGRGIAKFPGVAFKNSVGLLVDNFGIDGNLGFGIRKRPSEYDWIVFGGGVDDVIYPGQTLMIAKLYQNGLNTGLSGVPVTAPLSRSLERGPKCIVFKELLFSGEISCEGCQSTKVEKVFIEDKHIA